MGMSADAFAVWGYRLTEEDAGKLIGSPGDAAGEVLLVSLGDALDLWLDLLYDGRGPSERLGFWVAHYDHDWPEFVVGQGKHAFECTVERAPKNPCANGLTEPYELFKKHLEEAGIKPDYDLWFGCNYG